MRVVFPQKKNLELNEGIIFGIECVPSLSQTHEHQPQDYHFFFFALFQVSAYTDRLKTPTKTDKYPDREEGGRERRGEGYRGK